MTSYEEFLTAKVDFDRSYGHAVPDDAVHPLLMPHQRDIVRWAVHGGRRAISPLLCVRWRPS